jgi:hypothetical protein
MRELARSMASFSWAMSVFGVQQMTNLMSPRRAVDAFDAVTRQAEEALGPGLRAAFRTGDRMQAAMMDLSFSLVGLGPKKDAPSGPLAQAESLGIEILQVGVDSASWMNGTAWRQQQGTGGWGPIPPPPGPARSK